MVVHRLDRFEEFHGASLHLVRAIELTDAIHRRKPVEGVHKRVIPEEDPKGIQLRVLDLPEAGGLFPHTLPEGHGLLGLPEQRNHDLGGVLLAHVLVEAGNDVLDRSVGQGGWLLSHAHQ